MTRLEEILKSEERTWTEFAADNWRKYRQSRCIAKREENGIVVCGLRSEAGCCYSQCVLEHFFN